MAGGRIADNETIRRFESATADAFRRLAIESGRFVWLAVSGGRDSVAMLHAVARSQVVPVGRVGVIHVDHRLREDSGEDAEFVCAIAERLGASFRMVTLEPEASSEERSEDWARKRRYEAFEEVCGGGTKSFVATAHTADDQAETILHRIARGTGIAGLGGIPEERALGNGLTLIRPLLRVSRGEVTAYLESIGERWRDDATNASSDFTRNRIRHELMPLLKTFNPNVAEALVRLGDTAREHSTLVDAIVSERMHGQKIGDAISLERLLGADSLVLAECFRWYWRECGWPEQGMTRTHWNQLVDLVQTNRSNRRASLPGGITAKRTRDAIEFQRN